MTEAEYILASDNARLMLVNTLLREMMPACWPETVISPDERAKVIDIIYEWLERLSKTCQEHIEAEPDAMTTGADR